jgi:uncharacterized protein
MNIKPLNSILVKPAGPDCNLACGYCFYSEKSAMFGRAENHRMTGRVLDEMIRQLLAQSVDQVSIGWQGGEPTIMGLDFFKKAIALMQRHGRGQAVGNGLQTNGLLLDREWAGFLKQYNFLVGLSLDGPEHVHDHYRRTKGGKGTWRAVTDKAKLLLDTGVQVNALIVVNDYSAGFPEEIYSFHKEIGLNHMQFVPCVETDPDDTTRAAPFSVSDDQYGPFLCRLFDLWLSDFVNSSPTTSIRFFDSVFYTYAGLTPPECTLFSECGVYVVVEHNGDVYSCDFFVEPQWKLGNIMEHDLKDMLNSGLQNKFGRIKADLPDACTVCKWLGHCRGGCVKDRLRDPRDNRISHFCGAYKMFFEHADQRLRGLADEWKRGHRQNI